MILAATGNKYQLDQLEQALKIQFSDDEIRYHDDRTGKQHDRFLGGAVDEEDEHFSGNEEGLENNDEYLDALATAQQEEEAEALASLATANRTLREAQDKQHQVRMARGSFLQQQLQRDRTNKRPERKCVICNGPHWASQCPEKQGKPSEKKGETTAHTTYGEFSMAIHTETSMFAQEDGLETGEALIDCGATKSMGSWEALDGLARMNGQRHGSTRFSLDRTKKTWYMFANGTRQQSEGEVAFKVNAGGRTSECKINCFNTSGVSILLSVHCQMGASIDFSTGAAFFRHLADQPFVQLEREPHL